MKIVLLMLASLVTAQAYAEVIVCSKKRPTWSEINDGKVSWQGEGPAIAVNVAANRVTWIGSGGYVSLIGVQTASDVKITRIDGRATQEQILSHRKTGNILDITLADSLGGEGLLRINLNGSLSADWQHTTDSMRERFEFCTKNVLE